MDITSVLRSAEDSLPTLNQNLSTSTASALPAFTADASTYWKMGASLIMGVAGFLYIGYGKKNNDVPKIIIGLLLTIGSMFIF